MKKIPTIKERKLNYPSQRDLERDIRVRRFSGALIAYIGGVKTKIIADEGHIVCTSR